MPFQPGESGNPEGRPKGSENAVRAKLREKITEFLLDNFDAVIEEVNQLPTEQKLKFYFMLLPYGLSKKKEDPPPSPEQLTDGQVEDVWSKLEKITSSQLNKVMGGFDPYKPHAGNIKHANDITKGG